MSTAKSSVWIFSITWFANPDTQPIAHKAFEKLAKRYVYQYEKCPSTGNIHLQGYVNLYKKQLATGKKLGRMLNALGLNGVTCKPASNAGKLALQQYCMKEETRVEGPWADHPIYLARDLSIMSKPRPWQQSVMDIIKKEPDDRTIHWICDLGGNVGKSKLLKYLCYNKLAKRVPLGNATQIKTNVFSQGAHRCYVVDLPRTTGNTESMKDLISALEEIKNGWVASAMYGKYQELMMEPPHVFVISNEYPPMNMMSMDRWKLYSINVKPFLLYKPYSLINKMVREKSPKSPEIL